MVAKPHRMDAIAAEAWEIYDSRLRTKLEPHENGKFVVLNLDTGEYELDADEMEASRRASERFGGARLVTLRVGTFAAHQIGAWGHRGP